MELGVVTSLLNASYDAVVEVDDSWKLLGESTRLLSTMLGYGESEAGEAAWLGSGDAESSGPKKKLPLEHTCLDGDVDDLFGLCTLHAWIRFRSCSSE